MEPFFPCIIADYETLVMGLTSVQYFLFNHKSSSTLSIFIVIDLWIVMLTQVHARCYGVLEPVNGVLWLCNLCRSGAPPPPCCLCPLIGMLRPFDIMLWYRFNYMVLSIVIELLVGGAMKPTTDGRWAHLACAMWIPG